MEYGSDDDDWDPAEIEKVHAAAVDTYAATQQQRTQSHARAGPTFKDLQQYTPPDTLREDDIDALVKEKQKYEKLARDKQGELLVLRSNISRTTADHANALDSIQRANRQTIENLREELDAYKESVARLETDLTFQQQELRDAKLKARQHATASHSTSPGRKASGHLVGNGFPKKIDFERGDTTGLSHASATRKRKRYSRHTSNDDNALDDFDLAEQRATQARNGDKSPAPVGDQVDADQTFSQGIQNNAASPAISREMSQVTESMAKTSVEHLTAPQASTQKAEILDTILEAIAPDGTGCLQTLMSLESARRSGTSIGQLLLRSINKLCSADTPEVVVLQATKIIVDEFVSREQPVQHSNALLTILFALLQSCPSAVSTEALVENDLGHSVILKLQELAEKEQDVSKKSQYIGAMLQLVQANGWDTGECLQLPNPFSPSFLKHILVSTANSQHRILLLETLARLAKGPEINLATHELLEIITHNIDKDDMSRPDRNLVRLKTIQCLYCIVIHKADAISRLRTSRHVIPRVVRRLSRELEIMHESSSPSQNMSLLRALVKFYHMLLKDEDNTTSEHHWRNLEVRATHLTAMTRIVYAEEHDGFDTTTQDLAMDLLEMAVSPEEGNDIYEIMGGV